MNIKQIISGFLMIFLSAFLIIFTIGTSITMNINPSKILNAMEKVNYINNAEINAREVLINYLPDEKVEELLENTSISSQIREMVSGIDNNTVEKNANEKKQEVKIQIINILDESIDDNNKEMFADTVSSAYIKAIFPTTEFSLVGKINAEYSQKIVLALTVIVILSLSIIIFMYYGKKTFKWAIISLYNSIIFNLIAIFSLGIFDNITIGNKNTTALILKLLAQVKANIATQVAITVVVAIFFNYIAYFRKRKHKNK